HCLYQRLEAVTLTHQATLEFTAHVHCRRQCQRCRRLVASLQDPSPAHHAPQSAKCISL
ncbi:hypothetical protein KXV52_005317, partial [Aspergillus fumigatus]